MPLLKVISNIRFWIFLLFIIRLIGITNPPLEVGHNWRQTTVAMVARNFLEIDNNILYPRIDFAGEKTGITGMEFPLLNYLIYLLSEFFGYQHWYGRLINLIVSSFGLFFFYKLLQKYFTEQVSFYSTIILSISIWFHFSRKIMPDTFSMSLIIACIYYGSNYLESKLQNVKFLLLYLLLLLLGTLSKLPMGYLLVVFLLLIFNKEISIKRKIIFTLTSIFGLFPMLIWYFYWVPFLVDEYGFWHFFMGKNFENGFYEITHNINEALKNFYFNAINYSGFVFFIFGTLAAIIKKEYKLLFILTLATLSFSLVIFKAGFTFYHHDYYIIPYVPVMALVAGYGLSQIKYSKLTLLFLVIISAENLANKLHDFKIKDKAKGIYTLEQDLDKIAQKKDLILINSASYPTPMYFSHRKGWIETNENIVNQTHINILIKRGLKYIVILKRNFGAEIKLNNYSIVFENENYSIYKI